MRSSTLRVGPAVYLDPDAESTSSRVLATRGTDVCGSFGSFDQAVSRAASTRPVSIANRANAVTVPPYWALERTASLFALPIQMDS